jgi:cytochrome c-type biogenesis protein CcmI
MGLLKLLTFPVSGPAAGGKWVLQTILEQAERQHYDVGAIQQQMAELARQYQNGLIGDEEFDRQEEALLQRLLEAREYHQRKQEQT